MNQRTRFPLSIAVLAIMIGASALLALFYVSFRESVTREHDAFIRFARHDSLLERSYRLTWDAHTVARRTLIERTSLQEAAPNFREVILDLDASCRAIATDRESFGATWDLVSAYLDAIGRIKDGLTQIMDPGPGRDQTSPLAVSLMQGRVSAQMEDFRRMREGLHQRFVADRLGAIADVDEQIAATYSRWAIASFLFVVVGVVTTVVLLRHERRAEQRTRQAAAGEEQFRSLVEQSQDGVVIIRNGTVAYANVAALRLFEFASFDEMQRSDFFALAGPSVRALMMGHATDRADLARGEEVRSLTHQGRMLDLEVNASVITWDHTAAVQATFRDITSRKMQEREQALLMWEQEALSQIDRRLIGVVDLGRILDSILGHLVNLTKAPWAGVLMREGTSQRFRWRSMVGGNAPAPQEPFALAPSLRAILGSHEPFVLQESATPVADRLTHLAGVADEHILSSVWIPLKGEPDVRGVLTVGYRQPHDFTRRELRLLVSLAEKMSIAAANASLYEDLLAREKELEILSGLRVNAQEEERRRIAREIHDGLGQILTAVKFNIEILEDSPSLNDEDHRRIADVKTLLDNVMKEAREISYNLMPSVLDDFGLAPALQLLAERFGAQTSVHVTFVAQGMTDRLPGPVEIALYRIVQEALTNAVRHGAATHVAIQAFRSGLQVRLTIEDNGRGMDPDQSLERRVIGSGIGLASMRERVNSFRGELAIESSPGNGTLITVHIPIAPPSPLS
jgi:PAS domain S-box-containing protein